MMKRSVFVYLLMVSMAAGCVRPTAKASLSCERKIAIPARLTESGTVVLFGEMHGSKEVPAFVGDFACAVANGEQTVLVGLEIATDEQTRIDTYLASAGRQADRQLLLSGAFWQRPAQDGRSSQAMLDLIERLRKLRKQGAGIDVLAFDVESTRMPGIKGNDRERAMADAITARLKKRPNRAAAIVLTGNLHVRTAKGTLWDPEFVPMGAHLARSHSIVSLDAKLPPGTVWLCMGAEASTCGKTGLKNGTQGGKTGQTTAIELFPEANPRGIEGVYALPSATASPPANAVRLGAHPD